VLWVSAIFGAIIGSFLNVVLLKKNTGESVTLGRSRCFSCGKTLSWFELIPVISFIIQRARCRKCGSKISWQYPIIEFITALLAVVVYLKFSNFGFTPYALKFTIFYFSVFCALLLVSVYDFKHKIIDKHFLYVFGVFAVVEFVFKNLNLSTMLASAVIFLFFYLLWRLSDGKWMGRGDSDLALFLALFLGHPLSLIMVLVSFWLGAIVGILLLLLKSSRFTIKSEIPFGPFLAAGTFIVWYLKDFLIIIYEFLYF